MQCAHVMAMAVQKIYPDAKVTIGPWIENGFYYDFDMEPLTDKDLKKIKKEMVSSLCLYCDVSAFLLLFNTLWEKIQMYSFDNAFWHRIYFLNHL